MVRSTHPGETTCLSCNRFHTCCESGISHMLQRFCEWEPSLFLQDGVPNRKGRKPNVVGGIGRRRVEARLIQPALETANEMIAGLQEIRASSDMRNPI